MKDKNELLREMEKAMDRYDLSKEIEKAYIGEWKYGVSMVPCDWVYEYVKQPEIVRCKDCVHRGKVEKCVLAAIAAEKSYPLFMLDNRGEWYCADAERKDDNA